MLKVITTLVHIIALPCEILSSVLTNLCNLSIIMPITWMGKKASEFQQVRLIPPVHIDSTTGFSYTVQINITESLVLICSLMKHTA